MSDTSKTYDDYWKDGKHLTQEWTPEFFEETLGSLVGKDRVLDYGCGLGYSYQRLLSSNVRTYLPSDVSSVARDDARCKGFESFEIAADGSVDLPDNSCDGAVCSEVFEHLWDPLASARELHRLLKPGGTLVATVPNFGYHQFRFLAFLRAQVPLEPETEANRYKGVHIRFFSKLMLERLMKDAGFKQVKVYGWCDGSVWDLFRATGKFGGIANFAHKYLPKFTRLGFLAKAWPNVCAPRLRVVAVK